MRNYLALNHIFRALADPTRRDIVELLCDRDAPVTSIAEPLPMSLATVTRHVQALERWGLIRTLKVGRLRARAPAPRPPARRPSDARQLSGIRSTLAAHTKSFSDSPRIACVVKVT